MIKRKLYTTPEVIVTKFEVNKNMEIQMNFWYNSFINDKKNIYILLL